MTSALQEVKKSTEQMGREAYLRNAISNPFEPYNDRFWWWQKGWDKEKNEKKRSYSPRTKISSK